MAVKKKLINATRSVLTPFEHYKYKISIKYKEYNIKIFPRIVEISLEKIIIISTEPE